MKTKVLLLFVFSIMLIACSGGTAEQVVQQSKLPTYTPYPTYTPFPGCPDCPECETCLEPEPCPTKEPCPTYKPQPTPEPEQVLVTATYPPDFSELYIFEGTGKSTTDLFSLPTGIIRVIWEYVGEGNFNFDIVNLETDDKEMLENTIGSATGQAILKVDASDLYIFDITMARGDWKITVEYRP
jgi:hypothetical protein